MTLLSEQTIKSQSDYQTRLNASIECACFLLHQELSFRGHDECECSSNQGNYLELLHFLSRNNKAIKKVTFNEAPRHNKLTSPNIQKDITQAAAEEITNVIIKDLGDSLFSILINESRDISIKEQIVVVLRYVDNNGHIIERFLGIQHVRDTTASSLKAAIEALFSKHGLSISRMHGQGYDGASNMRDEFNGLKALILNSNPSVYYVHCFAHRLQLTFVAVTKKHNEVGDVFNFISSIINIVGASCKRMEERFKMMRENDWESLLEKVSSFYIKHDIDILNMDDEYKLRGRSRRKSQGITNLHHFRYELFNNIIDMQLTELNDRFTEMMDLMVLGDQLDTYIIDLRGDDEFSGIEGIASLIEKMVKTKKNLIFPLVYMLIKLSLLLPVATATVERVFSAMHIIKSRLRNRMGDKWMNDSLVVYIEKDIFDKIDNEAIMKRFRNIKTRREQL
ncbi:uncharacterized protein LOC133668101 [Populus nigra]|uniref:uncharacterized protein LOC133668101 n=1 Tax=Populus nigra TaxID=3691 RepID=UPI002B26A4EA|nr:uncharacterized protein LOC133668101 [Populus nigra]